MKILECQTGIRSQILRIPVCREKRMIIRPIAHIENDFPEKFGLPRQSGLAPHLISRIIMEPEYRTPEAFRGIEEYDRLWIL